LHQVGISLYFMRKMHGQTTLMPAVYYNRRAILNVIRIPKIL